MDFINQYFTETKEIIEKIDREQILKMISIINKVRTRSGRLFILGVGGGAGHASHAVNDFRKICGLEAYTPTDNVSELTARINDDGWESAIVNWLEISNLNSSDAVFIMSVGGGNQKKNVSVNLIKAIKFAKKTGTRILGIVGRDGGYTKKVGDNVILIPTIDKKLVTPYCESFHSIVWHCLASHPLLQINKTKW